MSDPLLIALGAVVVLVAAAIVWRTFSVRETDSAADDYRHALEHWIDGDLDTASALLRRVVHADPDAVEPFLYLGILLRLQGDPGKAAVLHRALTVRRGLTRNQRVSVGLALAEDLVDLERWDEAAGVLDPLQRLAQRHRRFWLARFAQRHGQGNLPDAARALKHAPKHCNETDGAELRKAYVAFQLDRALEHALKGEAGDARARLRDVEKLPEAASRAALVRAVLAAMADDTAAAVTEAAEHLLDSPEELGIVLPLLQDSLLRSGQFARTIPILERACQAENAPPSLWIDLALLYEKLDRRDEALQLLTAKSEQGGLTPNVAAPLLRLLAREAGETDFGRVWELLEIPRATTGWACCTCGRPDRHVRWFCPDCRSFDSYRVGCRKREAD